MNLVSVQAQSLLGLGCPCNQLGAIDDYDVITIGGVQYSVNQVIDKTVIAKRDTKIFSSPGGTVLGTIKAGQPIGKVFSYLKPTQTKDGNAWLMFEKTYNNYYYVPNEVIDQELLKRVTKNLETEKKEEADQQARENDPVSYYLKKFGLPAILLIGAIVIVKEVVKTKSKKEAPEKEESKPALSGVVNTKRKKKNSLKVYHI